MGACLSSRSGGSGGVVSDEIDTDIGRDGRASSSQPTRPNVSLLLASRLKLRLAAKAKAQRAIRYSYNDGVLDESDSGPIELAISRLKIDDLRAVTAGLNVNDALTLTLYHRRRVGGSGEGKDGESNPLEEENDENADTQIKKTNNECTKWVTVDTSRCFPDPNKNNQFIVHFRERHRRELSKHKAPVFVLPSDVSLENNSLRLVVAMNSKTKRRESNDTVDTYGSDVTGGVYGKPQGVARGSKLTQKVMGEANFSVKDLLADDRRVCKKELKTTDRVANLGPVQSRSGVVFFNLTPQVVSREWIKKSSVRIRTPINSLSFESLHKRFKDESNLLTGKKQIAETSWVKHRKEMEGVKKRERVETRDSIRQETRGRKYASSNGGAARNRGGGSRRRQDDPGWDDEDDIALSREGHRPQYVKGGLGG